MSRMNLTVKESELLALNRRVAHWLGLDPRYTISSNIAMAVARVTGTSFETAKLLFHAGVAGFAAYIVGLFGVALEQAFGMALAVFGWLESFDSSRIW